MNRDLVTKALRFLCCLALSMLAPSIAFADFPPVTTFPNTGFYQARTLQDTNNITVMELTGNYDMNTSAGVANVEPRTVIAKEFYRLHPDHYDFVVVFTNFEFDTGQFQAFHLGVQNKVKGLGLPQFDYTSAFGSNGKLQGFIDMAALSRYVTDPYDPQFETVMQTFSHEFLHQWGIGSHILNADGSLSNALLGPQQAHWSFLLNTDASVEYGNEWRDNGDGTFTSVASRQFYSPLDLYLMGMYAKSEVPPFYLIQAPSVDPTQYPQTGATVTGTRQNLTIDNIIAADGARVPDSSTSQKTFRLGFVLLGRAGADPTPAQIAAVNGIRTALEGRMSALTGGRAIMQTYLDTTGAGAGAPSGGGVPGTIRTGVASTADGKTWLRNKQASNGSWSDVAFTTLRDTALATSTLVDVDSADFTGRQQAFAWLQAQSSNNTDYQARRIATLFRGGISLPSDVANLAGAQNSDGGWGVAPGYQSNAVDTSLALWALQSFTSSVPAANIQSGQAYLATVQNSDGGWGNSSGGVSRIAATAAALRAFGGAAMPAAAKANALTYLAAHQNQDGGFGDGGSSTVHDTANVVLALVGQNALGSINNGNAISYVSSTQHTDGSWDGTVYSTSLALEMLNNSAIFNWTASSLTANPSGPLDGQQTMLTFTVANNGATAAPTGIARVYDGNPASGGVQIGSDLSIPTLAPGQSINLSVAWDTTNKSGQHTIEAVVDPNNTVAEASKSDNTATLALTVATAPQLADLVINTSSITITPPRPTKIPTTLAISAQVENIGQTDADNVLITLTTGSGASAVIVDQKTLNLLGRTTQVVNFTATLANAGTVQYTITVDPNNQISQASRSGDVATVSVQTTAALDVGLAASDITAPSGPVLLGSDAQFTAVVHNYGTQDSPPFNVTYTVTDGTNTAQVATHQVQLASGTTATQQLVWRSTLSGNLNFVVNVDPANTLTESDRSNNVASAPFQVIAVNGAELTVSYTDFGFNPMPILQGKPLTISEVVRNIGNVAATNVQVAFYDGDPSGGKMIGTMQTIANIAAGASAPVSVTWPSFPDAQSHLIYCVVDPAQQITQVSRAADSTFIVESGLSLPDLAISSADLSASPANPKPGDAIALTATVNNLGQQSAANVVVRAYNGDPANGGTQAGADQIIASFNGLSAQSVTFAIPASASNGALPIFVVVDPNNAIVESSKANNSASLNLIVQNGNFYVTNRYFSPNGDGVQDDTTFSFILGSATNATVNVVNKRGVTVRSYSGDTLNGIQSGTVTWDGLDSTGSVVADGDYTMNVSSGTTVLGQVIVTVDTNRSSIIDAIDTPYQLFTNLTCSLNSSTWPGTLAITADEQRIILNDNAPNGGGVVNLPGGLYVESSDVATLTQLPSPPNAAGGATWDGNVMTASLNGEKVAATYSTYTNNAESVALWVMNGDGSGLTQLNKQQNPAPFDYGSLGTTSILSANGSAFYALLNTTLESIPTDGVTAPTILLQQSDYGSSSASISSVDYSPDRTMALVATSDSGQFSYFLIDMIAGRRSKLAVGPPMYGSYSKRKWAPNSKLFLMGGMLANDLGEQEPEPFEAVFNVYDTNFNLVQSFTTSDSVNATVSNAYGGSVSGSDWGGYGGSISDPDWSSNGQEFVFGHSFVTGNVVIYGEAERTPKGDTPKSVKTQPHMSDKATTPSGGGNWHVMTIANVLTGQLQEIADTTLSVYGPQDMPASYSWAPNERTVIRVRNEQCSPSSGDSCVDAISLDDNNAIRNLFQNWQNSPDVLSNAYSDGIGFQGFIPSGRKLMFTSSRDADSTGSACYRTGPDQYAFGSLLNMTADLRPLYNSNGGGLRLLGTAADLNFASYLIEYSTAAAPNTWSPVAPPSSTPVVNDVFTTWVPPAYGNYYLRLTVTDLAGNKTQVVHNVAWANTPSITDLYTDNNFISPNGDGVQDTVSLHYRVLQPVHLEFTVSDANNNIVRTVPVDQSAIGTQSNFVWDGRDDNGLLVKDGVYSIAVQNYQFFVTVDDTPPAVTLSMSNAYAQVSVPCGTSSCLVVGYQPSLSWTSTDANVLSGLIESAIGANPSTWNQAAFPQVPGIPGVAYLTDSTFLNTQYRYTVTDKAGNKTVASAPLGLQQVFFAAYAVHKQIPAPTNSTAGATNTPVWIPDSYMTYYDSTTGQVTVADLPALQGIAAGYPLRLTVDESVISPTASVVLQYRAVGPNDGTIALTDLDSLTWNEVTVSNFVSPPSYAPVSGVANQQFEFLWDMAGIQPQTPYLLRLKIVGQDGNSYPVVNPYVFTITNDLAITKVIDERNTSVEVDATGFWTSPFTKVDLLLQSPDDPRYTTPQVIATDLAPGFTFNYLLGQELLQQLGMVLCDNYSFSLQGTLSTGEVVKSGPAALLPLCLGVNWQASPESSPSCNTPAPNKIDITFKPFANDGRTLTQMLFGSVSSNGTETLINNWNAVNSGGSYNYTLDTSSLPDGAANYFVRVINEDGKQIDTPIGLTVEHEPSVINVTSPVEGQKMCGIKVPDPLHAGAMRTVVPIQVGFTENYPVSTETDYKDATVPSFVAIALAPPPPVPPLFGPLVWNNTKPEINPGSIVTSGQWAELGLYENIAEASNSQQQITVRARAYNAGGYLVCSPPVDFYFSNQVNVTPSTIDYKIFSPNGDGQFDVATLTVNPNEDVTVSIQVFPAVYNTSNNTWEPTGNMVRNLIQAQTLPVGSASFQWDGMNDGGTVVPDGNYVLQVTYTDGCGNQLVENQHTEVDNTPPKVVVSSPFANAQLGLIVPMQGSITDLNFISYQIEYAPASAPDSWVMIASSQLPTQPPAGNLQPLGNWNTLGLNGAVIFRVLATDSVANVTDLRIPVTINPAVTGLISYLDTTPSPFSPNGDGKLDTLSVRYGLLNSANIDLEIWSTDAVPVLIRTLNSSTSAQAGAATASWDGKSDSGTVPADGTYTAKLSAYAVAPSSGSEIEQSNFVLDNTPPSVVVTVPNSGIVNSQQNITASVSDLNLAGYQVFIASNPSQSDPASSTWQLVDQGNTAITNSVIEALSSLTAGSYAIKVDAADTAQNTTEVIKLFQIDNTAPAVTLSAPLSGSYLSAINGPVPVSGAVVDSYIANYSLSFGTGTPNPTTYTQLLTATALPAPAPLANWDVSKIADGPYTLLLYAQNQAGLTAQTTANVVIDNTPPVAAISSPAQGSYVTKTGVITGTASDLNISAYEIDIAPGTKATASLWSTLGTGSVSVSAGQLLNWQALPPDGPSTLRLTVKDKAGNIALAYSEIIVDTKPPAAPLNLAAQLQNTKDVQLTWTANTEPDLAGYILYRNGTAVNAPNALITTNSYLDANLATGVYAYTVVAVDKAGWLSLPSNVANASVNLSAPVATIFSPANGNVVSGLVNIQGTASDSAGFKQYVVSVGNGSSPTSWQVLRTSPVPTVADTLVQWNTLGLTENVPITLKLDSEDIYGTTVSATVTVTVDNTPPNPPLQLTATPNGTNVTLNWTASTSPDTAGYIIYRDQLIPNAPGVVVGSLKPYLIVPTNYLDQSVPNGNHTYYIQAMDKAGNMSTPSNSVNVTIHTGPPHMTIVQPVSGSTIGQTTYVLSTSADTDIASVQFQYKLATDTSWTNMGAPITQAPFATNWNPSSLAYGNYMIQAVGTDTSGLVDPAPTPINITYKNLQSPQQIVGVTALVNGNTVNLSWTASTATDLSGYLVDRVAPDSTTTRITSSPITATTLADPGLADGTYIYRVYAINTSNNVSKPSADTSVLVFTPIVVQPYTPTTGANFTLSGQGQAGYSVVLQTTGGNAVATFAANADGTFAQANLSLAEGDNQFVLVQKDAAGDISNQAPFHVMRGDPPATPTGVQGSVNGQTVSLQWNANTESNLSGYRVNLNGNDVLQTPAGATATASSTQPHIYWYQPYYFPSQVLDGDITTGWMPDSSQQIPGQWLALTYPAQVSLTQLSVAFQYWPLSDFNIEAWDGQVWVPIASVTNNDQLNVTTVFSQPYLTNMIRLKLVDNNPNVYITEMNTQGFTTQTATTWSGTAPDGVQIFNVYAENSLGMFSSPATSKQGVGDVTPPDVGTISGTAAGSNVNLSWTASAATDIAYYQIYRGGQQIYQTPDATTLTYVDTGLANGNYVYTYTATNTSGTMSAVSAPAPVTVNVPIQVGAIALTASATPAGSEIDLSWVVPANGPIPANFTLGRTQQSGGPYSPLFTNGDPTTTTYQDQSAVNGTTYYYQVTGYDNLGNLVLQSNEASAKPADTLPPAVPVLSMPTISAMPITVQTSYADIAGSTEPGAQVALIRDNLLQAKAVAFANPDILHFSANLGYGQYDVSDDGRMISAVSTSNQLNLIAIDTGATSTISNASSPGVTKWSHDASMLGLIQQDPNYGDSGLFIYKVGDGAAVRLTSLSMGNDMLTWSPDNSQLAVIAQDASGQAGLWLVNRNTQATQLLFASTAWQYGQTFAWSPDGKYIAFEYNGALQYIDVTNANTTTVDGSGYATNAHWSPDASQLIYQLYAPQANGYYVRQYALATASIAVVNGGGSNMSIPFWYDAGFDYIDYEDGSFVQYFANGSTGATLNDSGVWNSSNAVVTPSGYLVYQMGPNDAVRVSPPGIFRVPHQQLNTGSNVFTASATDAVGNQSAVSKPITVNFSVANLADLEVDTGNITVLPSAPVVGAPTTVTAIVQNIGAVAANNFNAVLAVTDPQGSVTTLANVVIAGLEPGNSTPVSAPWTPATSGKYSITITADPNNVVTEASKANNVAVLPITIATAALPAVSVTTDATNYQGNSPLNATVTVLNSGPTFNGQLNVRIEDTSGYLVTNLPSMPVTNLAYGNSLIDPATWNTGSTLAGSYRVVGQLVDSQSNVIATARSGFTIGSSLQLQASITTDQAQYSANQNVNLTAKLTLAAGNASLQNGSALVQVLDASGNVVFASTQSIATLLPGATASLSAVWNTGTSPVAGYTAKVTVSSGGSTMATAQAGFAVVNNPTVQLSGTVNLSSVAVASGDQLTINYGVTEGGTESLTALPITVTVINPTTQAVIATYSGSSNIAAGATATGQAQFPVSGWPLGTLQVLLSDTSNGSTIVLKTVTLQVVNRTLPVVTIVSPAAGAYLRGAAVPFVIQATSATSSIVKSEYSLDSSVWQPMALQSQANGLYGVSPASGADGPLTVYFRATDATNNVSPTASLAVTIDNTPPQITVAGVVDGQTYATSATPVVSVTDVNLASSTILLDNASFVSGTQVSAVGSHVLQINAADKAGNTSSTTVNFLIGQPIQLGLSQSLWNANRVLVLTACNDPGASGSACAAARYTAIDQFLSAQGVQHQMTSDSAGFTKAMRGGLYDTLWISEDQSGFGASLSGEIGEVVNNGVTLIVDGTATQTNTALDLIGGVTARSTIAANESVNLTAAPFGTAQTLVSTGNAQSLTLESGTQSDATFGTGGSLVAVAASALGRGHTLITGFDLGAALNGNSAGWSPAVAAVLKALTPAASANLTPGEVLPTQVGIANQGRAVAIDTLTAMPAGAAYLSSTPAGTANGTANTVDWDFNLSIAQNDALYLLERAPAAGGNYTVQTTVSTVASGTATAYGSSLSLPVVVTPAAINAANAVTALQSLSLSASVDQSLRTNLVNAINQAMSNFGLNSYTGYNVAIASMVKTAEGLANFSATDAGTLATLAAARGDIDAAIQEAQWRWTMTQPEVAITLSLDKPTYGPSDSVAVSENITNTTTSLALSGLSVTTAITDPNGNNVFGKSESPAQLGAGAQQPYSYSDALSDTAPGTYTVTMTVADRNGNQLAQSSTTFAVTSTAVTGFGLSGSVQVAPQQIPVGSTAMFSISVNDQGNSAVSNLPLTLTIVNPTTQQIVTQFTYSGNVAIGAVFNASSSWIATGAVGTAYQAVLTASLGGTQLPLGQSSFTVTPPPIQLGITQSLWNANRVLVLTACNDAGTSGSTCAASRYKAIDQLLTAQGVQHLMTSDVASFTFAMRGGIYDTLWIAEDQTGFGAGLTAEIGEVVNHGATLIVDGTATQTNAALDQLAGVASRAVVAANENVALSAAPFGTAQTLASVGNAQSLTLATGTQNDATYSAAGTPVAIAGKTLGKGKTLVAGFDLGAALVNNATWGSAINAAMTTLTPAATASLTPGEVLPTQVGVANQGSAVSVDTLTAMPAGASYFSSTPSGTANTAANTVDWDFSLAIGQNNTLYLLERAPTTGGNFSVQTTVSTVTGGTATVYGSALSLPVVVTPAATNAASAISALQSLSLSASGDQSLRTTAVNAINQAMSNFGLNSYTGYNVAIAGLVNTADSLANFSAADAGTLATLITTRSDIDAVIQEAQWRWTMTQPEVGITLSLDKTSYGPSDTVAISDLVTNTTKSATLAGLAVTTMVTDPNGTNVFSKSESPAQLAAGAQQPYSYADVLNDAAPGTYTVTLAVADRNGNALAQSSTTFVVTSTAVTGFGLGGSVQVSPQQIPIGSTAVFSIAVNDQGNSAVSNLPLTLTIVNPTTQQTVTQFTYSGNVAIGAVFNASSSWIAAGTAGTAYQAALTATISGKQLQLAQTSFTLGAQPQQLGITQTLWNANRVLVLTACTDSQSDIELQKNQSGGGGTTPTACSAARYKAIDSTLTASGMTHLMTTNATDFTFAMRTGLYDTMWISSDQSVFGDSLTAEVTEVVNGGASLIIDGANESCNSTFDLLGGIKSRSDMSSNEKVTLNGSFYPASSTLATVGSAQSFILSGSAQIEGTFAKSSGSSTQNVPALVYNSVGAGHTLIAGFDLGMTLETLSSSWSTALNSTFAAMTPKATTNLTPGEVLPVQSTVVNQGSAAASLDVRTTLPSGGSYLASLPSATFLSASNTADWSFALPATKTQNLYMTSRAPATGGSFNLETVLGTVSNGSTTPYGNALAFPFAVTPGATNASNAISGLQALSLTAKSDQSLRTSIISEINQAMTNFNLNTYAGYGAAIGQLVTIGTNLGGFSGGSASAIATVHGEIDAILQEAQWRWTLLQPEVKATLSIDKSNCQPTDTVNLTDNVSNITSSTTLTNLSVVTAIVGQNGALLYTKTETLPSFAAGANKSYDYSVSMTGAAPGTYTATLTVSDANGNKLAQSSVQFTVASTATTGAGLTGTVQASPQSVPVGAVETISIGVSDQGNAAVSGLPLTLTILNTSTNKSVMQFSFAPNINMGASYTASSNWTVTGSANVSYQAVLTASIGGQTLQLGQAKFTSAAPQVSLNIAQAQASWQNLLVYSACKRSTDGLLGQCGAVTLPVDNPATLAACDSARATMIDQTLDGLGVAHTIVTSAGDFLTKMRSGQYNSYWISNGATVLGEPDASELRAAVTRGSGLLVDGLDGGYTPELATCAGVAYKAPYAQSSEPLSITGKLYSPGSYTITAAPVQLTQASGSSGSVQATLASGSSIGSGIVSGTYGNGKTLAFAFDWATTMGSSSNKAWSTIGQNSVNYVEPAAATASSFVAGDVITLQTTIQNTSQTANLQVVQNLPQGAVVVSTSPSATVKSSSVTWNFSLAGGASQVLTLTLQVPGAAGSFTVGTTVSTVNGSQTSAYQTESFAFTVQSASQLLSQLIGAVQQQGTTTAQQQAASAAIISQLNQAQVALLAGNSQDEIMRLLLSVQIRIAGIDSNGKLTPILDNLIAAVERQYPQS